ncbi:DNA helicase Rep [Paralysiella testudinis]|uniref:ATP-dependent DNA helicase Rep n=1 Tax=Paralysiella testudinis TaxID=2809020 RepID=A0A892ZKZ8_9NEIS|nr:DNA helicase Rep [Paralysiella testudinis]QRQ81579.1 DNA helicase Rep [Paralysiella testudinis]
MKLNPQQHEAIHYLGGPLLVLAGAGSGKTRVITQKIAYLITEAGYPAHQIAAITFTNKAAREMQERIGKLLGKGQTRGLTVCTFHSLGMRILREEAARAGYKKQFSILDAADASKIIAELLGSSGREPVFKAQNRISRWKNDLTLPETALLQAENEWERQMAQLYAGYQDTLTSYQAVDFDDLIRLPAEILRDHNEVRHRWQHRLRYLLIDECQDTNTCQYALMRLLTGAEGQFTAVGDDDQSIYAWRGANVENLRLLQSDYPQIKVIKLEQNYRSTARILRVANQVIAHNPKLFAKTLWSQYGLGDMVDVIACKDEQHEAEVVVGRIAHQKLIGGDKVNYADFAILYRGNHQARVFEEALRSRHIPYRLSGGQSFFDKAEIKDVLAYVRLLANPDDDPAFLRAVTTPRRGVGDVTLAKLNAYAQIAHCSLFQAAQSMEALAELNSKNREHLQQFMALMQAHQSRAASEAAGSLLQNLLQDIGYENHLLLSEEGKSGEIKWRNVQDLAAWIGRKGEADGKNILEIAQTIALMTLLEGRDEEETDAVKMSTLHASKGLEYPQVFLVGCEEGLFPHGDSVEEGNIEEERRLMYVGITRAQKKLVLTHCIKRKRAGQWQFPEPSRFIDEMPAEDITVLGRKGGAPIVSQAEGKSRLSGMLAMLADKKQGG